MVTDRSVINSADKKGKAILLGNCPARRRRKEARPAEIVEAARICFINNGFAATRIDDVAKQAGVSKGTVYLYFETKEALFEAVVKAHVSPVIDSVIASIESDPDTPAAEQLKFCARTMYREMVGTDRRKLMHLIIAEGPRFPALADFYFRETISKGQQLICAVIRRGQERGELRANGLDRHPEILMAPTVVAGIFTLVFNKLSAEELDDYIEIHLEAASRALQVEPPTAARLGLPQTSR